MRNQQGVALIMAILVVALVTAAAVAMASKQQYDIRRTANIFNSDRAYQFALGAEDYARNVLEWDITKQGSNTDYLGEDWAQEVSVPVEGAMLSGKVQDLQGRINLNSLLDITGQPNPVMVARFQNLLKLLGLNEQIANAVLDWIDADSNARFDGGAEDNTYMSMDPPYRAANHLMASVSELLLVAGMDYESYQLLLPNITVLPVSNTAINVNTAPAGVLASLAESLTLEDGETLAEARPEDSFVNIDDFSGQALLSKDATYKDTGLDIKSSYFMVDAVARFDESIARLHSLLWRSDDGAVHVMMRSQGAF